jgi:nucleotide-binding universal stress UspA family protein/nitrite reductase/ring-hydroxylating ferredoxin subunit
VTYKRILCGTDGSVSAERAAAVAIGLATAGGAELIFAHAFDRPGTHPERVVGAAVEAAEAAGVRRVSGESRAGAAADALMALADERDVGVIVASGGRGKRYGLGQVAHRLAHHAPRDVLLVTSEASGGRATDEPPFRHIVVASDGSATADRAARRGFGLAETLGASVTLVFVGHPKTGDLITRDTIATFAGEIETAVELREGDPADEILKAAEDVKADLVVVGNKGMTGAKGFLLGSVPADVAEASTRDLLIVRTVMQTVTELGPGEGGIIERAGEKLAAFVDAGGELHLMSARCTHLGCTVAWNPGASTFDCPCHGSRYGPEGQVVNGPAARPLPPA